MGGSGVAVGGIGVDVGGTGVAVGGIGVDVGGNGVAVGGAGVFVGGTGVAVAGASVGATEVGVRVTNGSAVGSSSPVQPLNPTASINDAPAKPAKAKTARDLNAARSINPVNNKFNSHHRPDQRSLTPFNKSLDNDDQPIPCIPAHSIAMGNTIRPEPISEFNIGSIEKQHSPSAHAPHP